MTTDKLYNVANLVREILSETGLSNTIDNANKIITLYAKQSGEYISQNDRLMILLALKSE